MTIGLDLDDVLLDFSDTMHSYCNNRYYGTSYKRGQITSQDLVAVWGCDEAEKKRRVFDFYESPEHWAALPVHGAVEGVNNLRQNHDIHIVTAKPEELKEKTLEWLEKHFPQMFNGIHFTNHFHGSGPRRTKGDVCRELGIEIFVDDFLENAHDVASASIPVLLFDTPWNQGEVKPPITRVHSWDEIVRFLVENRANFVV